jgi:hypothetical protein
MMLVRLALAPLLLVLAAALPLRAQRLSSVPAPQTAIVPEAITVGDVFHAAIRVEAPPGVRVFFPDTLEVPDEVEAAGRRVISVDTAADRVIYTAAYPLTAWRPDSFALRGTHVQLVTERGEGRVAASFPRFAIQSVLPADTTGIEPKPAKDVLGAMRLLWPYLLALLLLLALLAFLYWLYRRRQSKPAVEAPVPVVPPRERALQALDHARAAGLVETGAMKEFYSLVTDAVRQYLDAIEPRWGADLTTSELAGRMRGSARDFEFGEILSVLGDADLVKFARRTPMAEEALARWGTARLWVERFDWPPRFTEAKAA